MKQESEHHGAHPPHLDHPRHGEDAHSETKQLARLMETLVRENRAQMADFVEAMRLRHELSIRIGRRTTQILRFSAAALIVLGLGIMALNLTLINHMMDITSRMDEISGHMASMRGNFDQVAGSVTDMDHRIATLNRQFDVLNGQMSYMTRDVNTMSSPMRMFPFRP